MKKVKVILFLIIILLFFSTKAIFAVDLRYGINSFPSNYQGYLNYLKQKYPNWQFYSLYTGIRWNDAVINENVFGKNLVPINYIDRWKNLNPEQYNVEVDKNWVDSSKEAVEYAMDPRNFLNEVRIFQFEKLSYDELSNTKDLIERILYGTEFYQNQVNYLNSSGVRIYTNDTYSDSILNAARQSRSKCISLSISYKARSRTIFIA